MELVVIFLGVTLSFLAEEWRDERNRRRDEANALAGISEELGADIEDLQGNLGRAERGHQAALWLQRSRDRQDVPHDSAIDALQDLLDISVFVPHASEYTALRSAGRLNIVQNRQLRNAITGTYERHSPLHRLSEIDEARRAELSEQVGSKFPPTVSDGGSPYAFTPAER